MRVAGNDSATIVSDRRTATGLEERRRLLTDTTFSPFTTELSSTTMIEQIDAVDDLPKPKPQINKNQKFMSHLRVSRNDMMVDDEFEAAGLTTDTDIIARFAGTEFSVLSD